MKTPIVKTLECIHVAISILKEIIQPILYRTTQFFMTKINCKLQFVNFNLIYILAENSKHDLYGTFNKISVREFLHINNILIIK